MVEPMGKSQKTLQGGLFAQELIKEVEDGKDR
jgi:hypothetical protein